MLKAARAQGKPMIVITMMTAAIAQPTAIHRPPNRIQSRLRRSDSTDTRTSRIGRKRRTERLTIGNHDLAVCQTAACEPGPAPSEASGVRDCRGLGVRPVHGLDAHFDNENCL